MTCDEMIHVSTQKHLTHIWEQRRWQRQRERQKNNRLRLAKQQLCSCTLFCTFLRHHCTTSTWKYLISLLWRTQRQDKDFLFFSWTSIQSFRILQKEMPTFHELNEMESYKRDKVWSSAILLFKWLFRFAAVAVVVCIKEIILLHEKFLQFDWLRAVVFQLNLKYLHVKITNLLWVVVYTYNSLTEKYGDLDHIWIIGLCHWVHIS